MGTEIVRVNGSDRGIVASEGFGKNEMTRSAETAALSVAARERAIVEARYVMAERHQRDWDTVRVRILQHCERTGFAEVARYKKPAGKKKINGQWVESFAEGLSARFAETARQEMTNTETSTDITYEDDLVRIVRATVVDLERNSIESRSIVVAKAVEKRGKQDRSNDEWKPPEGREVMSSRINSYGEPVYLVRATDDEIRMKQNSEISKATRDASLRLIPKDIRDDAETQIIATLADPRKTDPTAARKRLVDAFAKLSVLPDDLTTYIGSSLDRISPAQLNELRGLYSAINDGEVTFQEAMRRKYDTSAPPSDEPPDAKRPETTPEHDARLTKQMEEQADAIRPQPATDKDMTPEENAALDAKLAAEEAQPQTPREKPVFGRKK